MYLHIRISLWIAVWVYVCIGSAMERRRFSADDNEPNDAQLAVALSRLSAVERGQPDRSDTAKLSLSLSLSAYV